MGNKGLVCWKCGASLKDVPRPITRHSNCLACYAELHCCVMCKSYDSRYPNRCNDERADPPIHKDSANFCEFFKPRPNAFNTEEDRESKAAQSELKALFGEDAGDNEDEVNEPEKPAERDDERPLTAEEKARRELEALFKK